MANLHVDEIARLFSLRLDLLTVLLEIHEIIEEGLNLAVHKDPTRGGLGADSRTRVGDGEAGPGQERGPVISRGSLGRSASVPNNEGDAEINGQVLGISNSKTTSEKNFVRKSNNQDDGLQNSRGRQIMVKEFGDGRPREGGGVISQEEGMSFREEARQDTETMLKLNVDDKEGDGETDESEQKGSALSSIDGIVSVTSGDAEDDRSKSGHVGNDDERVYGGAKESENEDGLQLMDKGCITDNGNEANAGSVSREEREILIAIVENEELPDANMVAVEDQNQYPSLEMAKRRRPPSLRAKRSGKWHLRRE